MYNMLYNSEFVPSTHVNIGAKDTEWGPSIDVRDCNGVLFILSGDSEGLAYATSGAMHVQASTDAAGTFVNYGSTIACYSTRAVGPYNMMVLDCYKPSRPFIRAAFYHTTGDVVLTCMKYGMRKAGSTAARDTAQVIEGRVISS